ncbi:MAG: hypothetical protein NVSMB3_03800 [Acidobacteriaceae bacterium]
MPKDKGTTATNYTGPGIAGTDPYDDDSKEKRPPYSINQQFLVVNVPLKSSNTEIVNAVTQALNDRQDLPFFQNRIGKKGVPPPYTDPEVRSLLSSKADDAGASPANDQDSLLILINQEGYP